MKPSQPTAAADGSTWARPHSLVIAALAATAGVICARHFGLLGAATVVVACVAARLVATQAPSFGSRAWLCALPAAIGAVELPRPPISLPRAGTMSIDATVVTVRRDLAEQTMRLELRGRTSGATVTCMLAGIRAILPGDRVQGIARAPQRIDGPAQPSRNGRSGTRPPWIESRAQALRVTAPTGWLPNWRRTATRVRFHLEHSLLARVPGPDGRLLCHLVLGHGPRIDADLVNAHRATGLAHLLAVSGAHASMLAWMVALLFRAATGRDPWSDRGFRWFCAIFLAGYGAITGFDPPMSRALVAFAILLLVTAAGRRTFVAAALAGPALLGAALQPGDLGSPSFCLSYAAVAGLGLAGAFEPNTLLRRRIVGPLRASLWAVIATAPLTLYYFGQLAPWTILATPILAPLVALMLAMGLLTATLDGVVSGLPIATAWLAECCTSLYSMVVRACTELPAAPILASSAPPPSILIGVLLATFVWIAWSPSRRRVAMGSVLLCSPFFVTFQLQTPARVQMLSVGHGQAAILHADDGTSVLVDCGSLGNPRLAARRAESALAPSRSLDVLIVSHGDFDHYGAVEELTRRIHVGRAYLPQSLRNSTTAVALQRQGCRVHWIAPGATVEVTSGVQISTPLLELDPDSNERSAWVEARLRGIYCVFPGDAGPRSVAAWLAQAHRNSSPANTVDVLVIPHHGRGEPRPFDELLARTRPRLCLVSNRMHRSSDPVPPLLETARARGIPSLTTGARGDITIDASDPPRITCTRARRLQPRSVEQGQAQ